MRISLFFFGNHNEKSVFSNYQLLKDAAIFADQSGFSAIWTPERHFSPFGGNFAKPSITSSFIAACTHNIEVRAGSVVAPLHNPIEIAEEWAMVHNLSEGRAGIALAAGWNPIDFALYPDHYVKRHALLELTVETLRTLWKGDSIQRTDGRGKRIFLNIYPKPLSPIPIWITAAGGEQTFRLAGKLNVRLLTHLLNQDLDSLRQKINVYQNHLPQGEKGSVTLMLHTFLGDNLLQVESIVKDPLKRYLKTSLDLELKMNQESIEEDEREELLEFAFQRYFLSGGLFGGGDDCAKKIEYFASIGIDELACLIDFGPTHEQVMQSLSYLNQIFSKVASAV